MRPAITGPENRALILFIQTLALYKSFTYLLREEFRLPEIDFALGLAAPGGLTSGSAMHV